MSDNSDQSYEEEQDQNMEETEKEEGIKAWADLITDAMGEVDELNGDPEAVFTYANFGEFVEKLSEAYLSKVREIEDLKATKLFNTLKTTRDSFEDGSRDENWAKAFECSRYAVKQFMKNYEAVQLAMNEWGEEWRKENGTA